MSQSRPAATDFATLTEKAGEDRPRSLALEEIQPFSNHQHVSTSRQIADIQ